MTTTDSPHILQNGVPRSGNLWLFYLVRHCLLQAGINVKQVLQNHPVSAALSNERLGIAGIANTDFIRIEPLRCYYTILDVFRWAIVDLDGYVEGTNQVACHSPWIPASAEVYKKFSHLVYVIRDPRDMALSMARFAFTPFNRLHHPHGFATPQEYLDYHFTGLMQTWVQHVEGHLHNTSGLNAYFIFYERLVSDPEQELEILCRFLGLDLSTTQRLEVLQETGFDVIKSKQPNHLHKGGWGGWRTDLKNHQVRKASDIAGKLLEQLGYPMELADTRDWQSDSLRIP